MKAVHVEGPGSFRVVDRAEPQPAAGEAVLRIVAAGICASDVGIVEGHNPIAAYPLTLGHECVGVVEEAPPDAPLRPGDWATVYPSVGCGSCPACEAGRINHCPTFRVLGISHDRGVFAERIAVPAAQLLPVPDGLRGRNGALIEPTAVAVHGNRRAGAVAEQRAVVIGSGVIGTLIAQVARAYGAADVVAVDRMEARRDLLSKLGFERFVLADGAPLVERLREEGGPADVVFDTVCTGETIDAALEALSPGGRLVLVAAPRGAHEIPLGYAKVYRRELSLIASRNYVPDDFLEAMRLLDSGGVEAAPLITGSWPLDRFPEAYAELLAKPERHAKILLEP